MKASRRPSRLASVQAIAVAIDEPQRRSSRLRAGTSIGADVGAGEQRRLVDVEGEGRQVRLDHLDRDVPLLGDAEVDPGAAPGSCDASRRPPACARHARRASAASSVPRARSGSSGIPVIVVGDDVHASGSSRDRRRCDRWRARRCRGRGCRSSAGASRSSKPGVSGFGLKPVAPADRSSRRAASLSAKVPRKRVVGGEELLAAVLVVVGDAEVEEPARVERDRARGRSRRRRRRPAGRERDHSAAGSDQRQRRARAATGHRCRRLNSAPPRTSRRRLDDRPA